jgi:methanogenic corrinoid protein MtbC1
MADLKELYDAILTGNAKKAEAATKAAIAANVDPGELVAQYMIPAIDALVEAGVRDKTRVMIGGDPITQQFADEIGADGYSDNACAADALARKLASV